MMPLSEIFFLGIVLYLLYRFIFNFFIPIFRTTKQVREQFRNMQDSMRDTGSPFQHSYNQPQEEPQPRKKTDPGPTNNNTMGEYIDFEEIK